LGLNFDVFTTKELNKDMKYITEWNKYLIYESSMSRIHAHILKYDSAIITAFRYSPLSSYACDTKPPAIGSDEENALDTNLERNRGLKAILLRKGYGVTRVDGSYIENFDKAPEEQREVSEESFFVHNMKNDPKFFAALEALGVLFCQDSVLIIPKGGKDAYLLGTNDTWPGLGRKETVGDFKAGKEAEFMSRIRKRPFTFQAINNVTETFDALPRNSKWTVTSIAEKILQNKKLI